MSIATIAMILASISLSVSAQLTLKHGMNTEGVREAIGAGFFYSVGAVITSIPVLLGFLLYGASSAIWLVVLSRTEVSPAYPFVGLGIICTTLFARLILHEPLTPAKIIGSLCILVGILVVCK